MKLFAVLTLAIAGMAGQALADSNVALNGTVSTLGDGFGDWSAQWGSGSAAPLSSVTDGLYLPIRQQWNMGTVFWNGTGGGDANNFVTIVLNSRSTVNSFALQADNNDDYGIQYRDAGGVWQNLVTISPHRSWGMDMGYATLSAPVVTDAFRIRSVGGDGYYSVSEFQAMGNANPVPEPETYAMLLAGLGMLGFIARHRKAS